MKLTQGNFEDTLAFHCAEACPIHCSLYHKFRSKNDKD